jgi:hypothetical protein
MVAYGLRQPPLTCPPYRASLPLAIFGKSGASLPLAIFGKSGGVGFKLRISCLHVYLFYHLAYTSLLMGR